jgi:hypothetical protein
MCGETGCSPGARQQHSGLCVHGRQAEAWSRRAKAPPLMDVAAVGVGDAGGLGDGVLSPPNHDSMASFSRGSRTATAMTVRTSTTMVTTTR